MKNAEISAFFDPASFTLTYVVWNPSTRDAVIIDPVIDYDPATQLTSQSSLGQLVHLVREKNLKVHWILDTHAHADHLTGSRQLRNALPGALWGMGAALREVFDTFQKVFAWPSTLKLENLGVDRWFRDGEEFSAGALRFSVISTPGHTPACLTYRLGSWLFTGDALMMPDSGVGRCDFPGGSAGALYDSIRKLYAFPDDYEVFAGHDYQPGGRPLRYRSTLGEQKWGNIHLKETTSRADFVAFREGRDKTLTPPRLLNPSLDWNLGAHQIVRI